MSGLDISFSMKFFFLKPVTPVSRDGSIVPGDETSKDKTSDDETSEEDISGDGSSGDETSEEDTSDDETSDEIKMLLNNLNNTLVEINKLKKLILRKSRIIPVPKWCEPFGEEGNQHVDNDELPSDVKTLSGLLLKRNFFEEKLAELGVKVAR